MTEQSDSPWVCAGQKRRKRVGRDRYYTRGKSKGSGQPDPIPLWFRAHHAFWSSNSGRTKNSTRV